MCSHDAEGSTGRASVGRRTRLRRVNGISFAMESRTTLGTQLALPWMKGEDRRWSALKDGHDSPVVGGGWPGWTASGHDGPHLREVKTASGLPAKKKTQEPVGRLNGLLLKLVGGIARCRALFYKDRAI
ncbi:hypothetical protein CRG98_018986 [Punica granatum]|uniref:Uncharacterized protein n=1 Tax=Punica granatum TaxID=22663 RepID=A0A2I0JYW1_PUNGR|nr:hypothetical protein CRG98_018986 [Punica granatum]